MRFIYPEFLPALAFISIPILIHFIHFKRYKTVYFSQVNFLKAVKQESKKKNNLKQLLILISRILTITALVFVFCQPYLPANKQERKTSRKLVAVYVDNSFSMRNESGNGPLLELAKNKAMSIANSYGPGTNFLLMDNKNTPDQQQLLNKGQFISRLAEISTSPGSMNIAGVHQLLHNNLLKQQLKSEKIIYLISDFQDYICDFTTIETDTSTQTFLIPLTSQVTNNLLIDSCWFETPGHKKEREETLFVRIQNLSSQSYQNIPVHLKINDTIKAINNLNIEAEETKEIELIYKNNRAGIHRGVVELDDYPIVYDNQFYFSYEVRDKNQVLAIYKPEDPAIKNLEALFRKDSNLEFAKTEVKKIQLSQFPNYQCIFLVNLEEPSTGLIYALSRFVKAGGSLSIFPGTGADKTAYNKLYQSLQAQSIIQADSSRLKMENINFNHLLLQNAFLHEKDNLQLPFVNYSYQFSKSTTSNQTNIVEFNNKQTALAEYQVNKGILYNFSFPLAESTTDFNQHAIFVPLLYNMALNSFEAQQIQYEIQNKLVLLLPKNQALTTIQSITIKPEKSDNIIRLPLLNEYADQIRIDLQNTIHKAGFYTLLINNEFSKTLAFNYNRNESLSKQLLFDQLEEKLESAKFKTFSIIDTSQADFEEKIQEANDGIELWQLFLAFSLIFIAAEIAISRFWK